MCSTVRRAARALTQFYEEALRATGMRSSQLTILQVLWRGDDRRERWLRLTKSGKTSFNSQIK